MTTSLPETSASDLATRLLRQALERPGEVLEVADAPTPPARPAQRLSPAMAAVLHALSDRSTPLRLALTTAAEVDPAVWQTPAGTPAMLLIEVPALIEGPGPSPRHHDDPDLTPRLCIDGLRHLGVAGIARHFWRRRPDSARQPGVDLVLCSGRRLAAIGRQSQVWICD